MSMNFDLIINFVCAHASTPRGLEPRLYMGSSKDTGSERLRHTVTGPKEFIYSSVQHFLCKL